MRRKILAGSLVVLLAACGGGDAGKSDGAASKQATNPAESNTSKLEMYVLDCGTIEISDLDIFSTEGDYAGESGTFTDTCYVIRHPDGDLLWDLGLPSGLVGGPPQEDGVFTVSLERNITDQLIEIGLGPEEIEYVAISHQHFDHTGQVDQVQGATWLVHEDEYASMFPPIDETDEEEAGTGEETDAGTDANPFAGFESLETETFRGEKDVFGDGSVIIFETPGHTPGHTSLQVNLPETGPVLLTGDLYHRIESREKERVPRFNVSEPMTRESIKAFEDRARRLGAKVIIQHSEEEIAALPKAPDPMR